LDVISTTTGAPGSNANVVVSGTSPTQHLAFTVPSGLKGDTGATGATGATGPSNTLSVGGITTGAAGTNAIASLSGTSPSQSIYFTIPAGVKGDTGNTGATGAKGDTGNTGATGATPTLSVNSTVATLGYGNNGIASIGGTLPNYPKIYLTLPAGPQGPVGTEANALVSTYGDNKKLTFNSQGLKGAVLYSGNAGSITLPSVSGQLITEAPSDGSQYARKNAGWTAITTGNPFNQSLNTTDSPTFAGAVINGSASTNSVLKVGSLEFQPYAINNVWFGDNAYYDGSFKYRNNGSAGLFYFQGGSGEEGQFRMAPNGTAGDSFTPTTQLKIAYTGEFGIGSTISTVTGDFNGANFYVDSLGNATLFGNLTAANFPQTIPVTSVAGKTGDVTLSASDVGAASVAQSIAFSIALS
jgi:hypothetical protein